MHIAEIGVAACIPAIDQRVEETYLEFQPVPEQILTDGKKQVGVAVESAVQVIALGAIVS